MKTWLAGALSAMGTLLVVGIVQHDRPQHASQVVSSELQNDDVHGVERDTTRFTKPTIEPIRAARDLDPRIVELGRKLFEDRRLSSDGSVSCASCHDIEQGGADGRRVSVGVGGSEGDMNAPTVLNAANNFAQFFNGRAATLEEQVGGPLTDAKEMGQTWPNALATIRGDSEYARSFALLFSEGVTIRSVETAIATYERALVTPNSRFDRFLAGDTTAINEREKRGYERFQTVGCITCHNGVNVGSNSFQPFGVSASFASAGQAVSSEDLGRFEVTREESDKFKFKVPTLRNIERTAPYFHDGSVATLEEAVEIMARYQLGQKLQPAEVADIVAFLHTLSAPRPQ